MFLTKYVVTFAENMHGLQTIVTLGVHQKCDFDTISAYIF